MQIDIPADLQAPKSYLFNTPSSWTVPRVIFN